MMLGFSMFVIFLGVSRAKVASYHEIKMEDLNSRDTFFRTRKSNPSQMHEIIISTRQQNIDVLERMVLERSKPGTQLYQQWMSFEEVGDIIDASASSLEIERWLSEHNITVAWKSKRAEYLKATATISEWEILFAAKFYEWHDFAGAPNEKSVYHRTRRIQIPLSLKSHIDSIFNTVQIPPVITQHYVSRSHPNLFKTVFSAEMSELSNGKVTVSFLNQFYEITSNIGLMQSSQSVVQMSRQYFSPDDLNTFQSKYDLLHQSAIDVNGFTTTSCSTSGSEPNCDEGNLDIQYIMGVAQNVTSIYWYVPGNNPFLSWITDISNDANPPQSNSISWGSVEQSIDSGTLNSFKNEALKLAAIGVTVLVSSGDDGVANFGCGCNSSYPMGGYYNCACQTDSSSTSKWTGVGTWSGTGYFPSFPASCPYVTAVGGSMGYDGSTPSPGDPEVACQSQLGGVITTGGGFSTFYKQPSWQTEAVDGYFNSLSSNEIPVDGFNRLGRGYPDISFVGIKYQVVIANIIFNLYGTSCSAPVAAALVSLINSKRLALNLPSIGFINPTLYSTNSTSFNDISSGFNKCCKSPNEETCCSAGFFSTKGWDPVTGWGSVSFPKFAAMFNISAPYTKIDDINSSNVLTKIAAILVILAVLISIITVFSVLALSVLFKKNPN